MQRGAYPYASTNEQEPQAAFSLDGNQQISVAQIPILRFGLGRFDDVLGYLYLGTSGERVDCQIDEQQFLRCQSRDSPFFNEFYDCFRDLVEFGIPNQVKYGGNCRRTDIKVERVAV